ncbi:hypothetical protein J6590_056380 [Homalodisca vitripennis]|nr:hypothetical protein J6590_056380 [Homalodisca vitripennis]
MDVTKSAELLGVILDDGAGTPHPTLNTVPPIQGSFGPAEALRWANFLRKQKYKYKYKTCFAVKFAAFSVLARSPITTHYAVLSLATIKWIGDVQFSV